VEVRRKASRKATDDHFHHWTHSERHVCKTVTQVGRSADRGRGSCSHLLGVAFLRNSGSEIPTEVSTFNVLDDFGHVGTGCPFRAGAFQGLGFELAHHGRDLLHLVLGLQTALIHLASGACADDAGIGVALSIIGVCGGREHCVEFAPGRVNVAAELRSVVDHDSVGDIEGLDAVTKELVLVTEVDVLGAKLWMGRVSSTLLGE
jgi:hypothetical protein